MKRIIVLSLLLTSCGAIEDVQYLEKNHHKAIEYGEDFIQEQEEQAKKIEQEIRKEIERLKDLKEDVEEKVEEVKDCLEGKEIDPEEIERCL